LALLINAEGKLVLNFSDELVAGTCITHEGKITHERVQACLS
jgi:NAD/NADP transhydrogenase alpha subunit